MKIIFKPILLLFLFIACSHSAIGQRTGEFKTAGSIPKNFGGMKIPLATGAGNIAGTFEIRWENKSNIRYNIRLNGGPQVVIPALSQLHYAADAGLFVVCGTSLLSHVEDRAMVRFYNAGGQLMRDLGTVAEFPFATRLADNGDFFLAGFRKKTGDGQVALLKFNANGDELWSKELGAEIPLKIYASGDGSTVSVITKPAEESANLTIRYFDENGVLLSQDDNHFAISAIEFLENGRILLCGGTTWEMIDRKDNFTVKAFGSLQGPTVGDFPVTENPQEGWFSIVSLADVQNELDYRVEAFESSTGQRIAETVLTGYPAWTPYRIGQLQQDGSLLINADATRIRLTLTY